MDEAVEKIHAGYEAFNRGDFDASAKFIHPDIVWNRVVDVESALEGRDAVRENMEPAVFAAQRAEVLETRSRATASCAAPSSTRRGQAAGSR